VFFNEVDELSAEREKDIVAERKERFVVKGFKNPSNTLHAL
jgi:hypothetical protein